MLLYFYHLGNLSGRSSSQETQSLFLPGWKEDLLVFGKLLSKQEALKDRLEPATMLLVQPLGYLLLCRQDMLTQELPLLQWVRELQITHLEKQLYVAASLGNFGHHCRLQVCRLEKCTPSTQPVCSGSSFCVKAESHQGTHKWKILSHLDSSLESKIRG